MSHDKEMSAVKQTRTPSEIYADIEAFQKLGSIENWQNRRPEAAQLLNEAIEIPGFENRIKVVRQRSKANASWKRINIQRGKGERPLCNPYPVVRGGKQTADEASAMFWEGFKDQITQDTPQRRKMLELQSLLRDGEHIELGCCGDEHCHGHLIREELIENWDPLDSRVTWLWDELDKPLHEAHEEPAEEAWKPPHLLDLDEWAERADELLRNHWGNLDAFDVSIVDKEISGNSPTVYLYKPGVATNAAGALVMQFEVADNSLERLTEESLPEYFARYLYWGALKAHLEQGEGPINQFVLNEGFNTFKARVNHWREFPYISVKRRSSPNSQWTTVENPVEALEWLRDWDKRGRPDTDAPLVRLNGQSIQADVGHMLNSGLEKIDKSGVGGMDLTAQLLNLAISTGQPYRSIRSAWNEFNGGVLEREIFASVLDEMLKGDEPLINVKDLAGESFHKM